MRAVIIGLALMLPLSAEAQIPFSGLTGEDGITLDGTSLFSDLPPFGFAPLELSIKNDTARDRRWTIHTRATRGWGSRDIAVTDRVLEVPKNSTRTFEIMAPLPGVSERVGHMDLALIVEGYGVRDSQGYLASRIPTYYDAPHPYVGMSAALEAKDRDRFIGNSSPIFVVKFEPKNFPSEWRALAGIDAIWLTPEDVALLPDEAQGALLDWVTQGGRIYVCTAEAPPPPPFGVERYGRYGLGEVRTMSWDGVGITSTVSVVAASLPIRDRSERERGPFHERLGKQTVNRALMLGFLLLFGLVIGPLNLFWLARHQQRARLLWTTPLISVAASVLLSLLILLQDGVGGSGRRFAVQLLMPDRASEVIVQEQIARTGVLVAASFPANEGELVEPIYLEDGYGTRTFGLSKNRHSGDWFNTRSVQAQRVEVVRGSRSRVELIGEEGGKPKLASTLPVGLERLFYVDERGEIWTASGVRPGDQLVLELATPAQLMEFFDRMLSQSTPFLRSLVERRRGERSYFFASSSAPIAVDTLASIRWEDDPSLILGPVKKVAP